MKPKANLQGFTKQDLGVKSLDKCTYIQGDTLKKASQIKSMLNHAVSRYQELVNEGKYIDASSHLHLINKYNTILSDIDNSGKSDLVTL